MNGRYYVIDEPSLSDLGSFDSEDAALAFVETLSPVNTDDLLDELTVSNESGPVFYGESLRQELERGANARKSVGSRGSGSSEESGGSGYGQGYAALAAKNHD